MRQGLHVIRDLSQLSSKFRHAGLDFRRVLLQLFEFEHQHGEPLVDVVMKLSSNASAFLFLRLDQFPAHTQDFFFEVLTTGYVLRKNKNSAHCAIGISPRTNFPSSPTSAASRFPTVLLSS